MKVCIGGTFSVLHIGHKLLIDKAFETAGPEGKVLIGIAEGNLIKDKKEVEPIEERKKELKTYLYRKGFLERAIIKTISDKYGPSMNEEFDAIVVSPETLKTAEEINFKRIEKGKKPLKIIKMPFVLGEDGLPISSSRIKNKEIDKNGKILRTD